ncbi:MAG TPA: protein kinase [Gemmatimonadaceae bacterium]|nr:protein kinase [Gemmatimonadaceae bacterium]
MAETVARLSTALGGRYVIEGEVGEGGMAMVYLARDVRHARPVALKVLKPELGALLGAERFLSEIRVTANLQHPNLLPLFDSGEADGLLFYVMPYVEGESLRRRIDRERQLPIDEAVRIATAVAMALDYAHRHGVIHRDLKPENILLHDGQPLIADFGIALAVSNAGGNRITQTGLSLGTPQYMSPEQATGDRNIDGRSDIYSLGAVLYEMLAGEPPHTGSTSQAIIARVITEKPRSVRASRPNVAPHVESTVARALEKLPADRFATARAFADALTGVVPVSATRGDAAARWERDLTSEPPKRPIALWSALGLAIVLAAWGWLRPRPAPDEPLRARFPIAPADSTPLREDIPGTNLALSPDGTQFVFVGGLPTSRVYLRGLNDLDARPIPGTERAVTPRFSPDGRWLSFVVDGQLKRIPLAGGQPLTIADNLGPDPASRYAWGDNDVIVFAHFQDGGLFRVSPSGGDPIRLTRPDTARHESAHSWPEVLPGGRAAVFVINSDTMTSPELAAVRLSDGEVVRLGVRGWNPRYVATGHLLFSRIETSSVSAVPFDAEGLRVTGPAVEVLEGLIVRPGGAAQISVSRTGTLVYVQITGTQLVQVNRAGIARQLLAGPGRFEGPRWSPNGDRIAFGIREVTGATNVWIHNVSLGTMTRLTSDGKSLGPGWTGDGRRIAWLVDTNREIRWQPWDGSGSPEVLGGIGKGFRAVDFPAAGKFFVTAANSGVWATGMHGDSASRLIVAVGGQSQPAISPDGRWLAYRSIQSGVSEVYVTSLAGGGRHQVSENGGVEPVWSSDGRTLFYRAPGRVMAATIRTAPEFVIQRRDALFADDYLRGVEHTAYDVLGSGNEFVMMRRGPEQQRVVIVLGWADELRERMAQAIAR